MWDGRRPRALRRTGFEGLHLIPGPSPGVPRRSGVVLFPELLGRDGEERAVRIEGVDGEEMSIDEWARKVKDAGLTPRGDARRIEDDEGEDGGKDAGGSEKNRTLEHGFGGDGALDFLSDDDDAASSLSSLPDDMDDD